jgi:hypothetical protein
MDKSLFPKNGTDVEKLTFLLPFAIQAPSVRNSQPWRFAAAGDALHLLADPSRKLRHVDPDGRELCISCGAALEHLAIAIRYHGYEAAIEHLPDHRNPHLLARIGLGPAIAPGADDLIPFYAIFKRTTERSAFKRRPIPGDLRTTLAASGRPGDVHIELIEERDRREAIAELVVEATRIQAADPGYRAELAAWWTPYRSSRADGVPAQARGVGFLGSALEQLLLEGVDLGKRRAATHRRRIVEAPLVAVLGTQADEPLSWLLCGRSLARLLLRARAAGLSASFFSEPTQVPAVRSNLTGLLSARGHPQVVLRLGYTNAGIRSETRRHPVDEVLSAGAD